jgi:hypothetical protein
VTLTAKAKAKSENDAYIDANVNIIILNIKDMIKSAARSGKSSVKIQWLFEEPFFQSKLLKALETALTGFKIETVHRYIRISWNEKLGTMAK